MNIQNIHIENFRNIVRADVEFGDINIFTGKNSSGKSNLLLALSQCLKTGTDFSDIFYDNVVTFSQGKSKAILKTTIGHINSHIVFTENERSTYIKPEKFVFENTFGKRTFSPIHQSLFFTGNYIKDATIPENTTGLTSKLNHFIKSPQKKHLESKLIFDKTIEIPEATETDDSKEKYIEKSVSKNPEDSEKFFNIFLGYENAIFSWVRPEVFSSTSIYQYVTERINNNEIYEQVLERLKNNESSKYSSIPFDKAKFIHLLADVQRNPKQNDLFQDDLKLYTKGLISGVNINVEGKIGNKGEIHVESSNSPKDIFFISAGTAVLLYFILLKNWTELPYRERSYTKPEVMIFDEIDSIIHPSLMNEFTEVLKAVSKNTQLFISTHSPHFIDRFNKSELFWLKDTLSVTEKAKPNKISSVYSYKDIIAKLPNNEYFSDRANSELFIDGLIDSVFPLI